MHMKRVQAQLRDDQVRALGELAGASNRPVAAILRDAVDAWIEADGRRRQRDRALAAIGGFHSGLGDLAEHHDRYLDDAIS
jgi:predicted transcriptional regulator